MSTQPSLRHLLRCRFCPSWQLQHLQEPQKILSFHFSTLIQLHLIPGWLFYLRQTSPLQLPLHLLQSSRQTLRHSFLQRHNPLWPTRHRLSQASRILLDQAQAGHQIHWESHYIQTHHRQNASQTDNTGHAILREYPKQSSQYHNPSHVGQCGSNSRWSIS